MNATRVSVLVSRTPHSLVSSRFRASRLVPHSRVGDDSGGNSGTWAASNRVTPNRVAPLPARRARQMFFVADYDAVCAIMTTSLFLSPVPSLSFHLMSFPLTPRITALGGWIFSFPFCLSFSVSHCYLLPADEDKLCSCLSRSLPRRLGHAKRRLSSFSFSLWGFSQYTCTRRIFRRSFSRLLLYVFSFISFLLRSTASIR